MGFTPREGSIPSSGTNQLGTLKPTFAPDARMIGCSFMRAISTVLAVFTVSCASAGGIHPEDHVPLAWSLSVGDSPESRTSLVCASEHQEPCVIPHGTDQQPKYATFMLHAQGPATTKFTGSLVVTYLNDPDPRNYVSQVNLTPNGKEVHHSVFSKITSVPGEYSARANLEETRGGSPPKAHEFNLPIIVQ